MKSTKIPETDEGRPYLKMKKIREATGCPASTIQYYHSLGLLQDTVKTGANMAYYHPDTIERVQYIRLLQSRYRLSIAKIKALIEERAMDDNTKVISCLNEMIFGPEPDDLLSIEKFSEQTGLDEELINKLVSIGLLVPIQTMMFDPQDVMIGKLLKASLSYDMQPEDIEFYAKSARALVEHEMILRNRLSENLSVEESSKVTLDLTQMARAFRTYVFDRTFQKRILSSIEVKPEQE